jgi:hypothetical protein
MKAVEHKHVVETDRLSIRSQAPEELEKRLSQKMENLVFHYPSFKVPRTVGDSSFNDIRNAQFTAHTHCSAVY